MTQLSPSLVQIYHYFSLTHLERVPAYIVGPEPVHEGDTYNAICDARRVSMDPDTTTVKHVTILRSPGCDRNYAMVVRLDDKNNKSSRKMVGVVRMRRRVECRGVATHSDVRGELSILRPPPCARIYI